MDKPQIGFIGLGLMGGAMVSRLQDKGYSVSVLGNRNRTELDKAVARGATEATTARDLAGTCDIIMLCVGTSEQVEGRMRGDDGIMAGLRKGAVVIDFGTSLPASTRALADEVAALGASYLDCPLGRTPSHALEGKLNMMCAGDEAALDQVRPVLEDLSENIFYLGASGNGHTVKLINNFFGQTMSAALGEAFAVADVAGVDRKQVFDVMFAGPLGSPYMGFMAAYALDGDPSQLAFSIGNATKDVGYYDQMTRDAGVPSKIAPAPLAVLREAVEAGMGDKMVPEILDHFVKTLGRG